MTAKTNEGLPPLTREQSVMSKRIPKLITFDMEAHQIFIDGEEFPWMVEEGWSIKDCGGVMTYVTLTLLADAVEVKPIDPARINHLQ